jgi:hypothetical protein
LPRDAATRQLIETLQSELADNDRHKQLNLFRYLLKYAEQPERLQPDKIADSTEIYTQAELDEREFGRFKQDAARQLKKALRGSLARFADSKEGKRAPLSITLEGEEWELTYTYRDPHVKQFWRPYMQSRPTTIVYTEGVFFRSLESRFFMRYLDVNNPEEGDFLKMLPPIMAQFGPFQPARHYVAAGDTSSIVHLTRWFERNGVETEHLPAYPTAKWLNGQGRNLIIIGNIRTISEMAALQGREGFDFRVDHDGIANLNSHRGEERKYADDFTAPGKAYGVISRYKDDETGVFITLFASNHGAFNEGVSRYLLTDAHAEALLQEMNVEGNAAPPDSFQLLFEVATAFEERARPCGTKLLAIRPSTASPSR